MQHYYRYHCYLQGKPKRDGQRRQVSFVVCCNDKANDDNPQNDELECHVFG